LPEALRDNTGVIFASAFPGYNSFADELSRYHIDHGRREQLAMLQSLQARAAELNGRSILGQEIDQRAEELRIVIETDPYLFDRRFLFKALSMGHSQLAEFIGARGPNTQINSACASTAQAIALAEDWIQAGRCSRVIIVSADNVTTDHLLDWMGAGFLASGAAATDEVVEDAAIPFDRRRHGMIVGMGAAALIVESAEAARERGIQPICEVLSTVTANSAFHGTRLDVKHISQLMEDLVAQAETRRGISRSQLAPKMVFVSHETYTPARGGSASAEIYALRQVFGDSADQIVIANTKGFTGHAMATGIEDVVAVKSLETGCVPPVANFKEVDPELGPLNLSKGGVYPVEYALRLAAGFGSQISMTLLRWVATKDGLHQGQDALGYAYRIVDPAAWRAWLGRVSGDPAATLEVVHRTLRVCDVRVPVRVPATLRDSQFSQPVPLPTVTMEALPKEEEPNVPEPAVARAASSSPMPAAPDPIPHPAITVQAEPAGLTKEETMEIAIQEKVLEIVAEKTGYPKDMLDLDLDLEADLGIDTVKQAEMFAAVRAAYNIPRDENLKLRDFPTLAHVIRFAHDRQPVPASAPPAPPSKIDAPATAPAPVAVAATDEAIKEKVLEIVAEKTGYPKDMLDLDLDLEADLGVDTVKQAEMFAAVRAAYNIPCDENLKLRDFPTLAHVIRFAHDRQPVPASAPLQETQSPQPVATPQPAPPQLARPRPALASLDAANNIPRRVPIPILRPALTLCKPTAVTLGPGSRIVLMPDKRGVAEALTKRLLAIGVEVLQIEDAPDADALVNRLKGWLATGPVQGVYWLAALDQEVSLRVMDLPGWREALRIRVKLLYATMRALYQQIAAPGTFLVSATLLGGQHGYDDPGATAPLGGPVVGVTKTYKRERPEVLVKAVDFELGCNPLETAGLLMAETLRDPGSVEVGYKAGERWTVGLQERPATDGQPGLTLDSNSVFVVTGAAGGIVSAITADLAAASGGTFYLLDLVPEPDPSNPDLARFANDREALKRDLFGRIQARGERATPALVEKELAALERAQAALTSINAVRDAGGTAHYFRVNLSDGYGVARVIDQVQQRSGHIDVLLHAAGMERSHFLPDKDPHEFDLVFDVKCDGWFNLLRAIGDMSLGATVAFSSIAGRFGNAGQADYSSANDLLCKITSSFRTTRPATRGIVIDWTAWGGIGMATRGSIPKMMELAGIDMLPPEAGVPLIRRELTAGGTRGEIVIAQRLGIMANEFDATGGLDSSAVQAAAENLACGPMIGKVVSMGVHSGLTIETTLDPSLQPFLHDHRIDGTAVLPGVMGIEAFAEAAQVMLPGWHVEAVEDIHFLAPFKFYRNQPRTLTIQAVISHQHDALLADCRLIGRRILPNKAEPEETTHFTAQVYLTRQVAERLSTKGLPKANGSSFKAADIYRIYFHGPAYQVLGRAWQDGNRIAGELARNLPDHHHPSELPTLMAPRLIELCFQTAGLWEIIKENRMGLPLQVRRVCFYQAPDFPNGPLFAVVTPHPDQASFDAEVVDASGILYLTVDGYGTVALPGSVDGELLTALWAHERDLAVAS